MMCIRTKNLGQRVMELMSWLPRLAVVCLPSLVAVSGQILIGAKLPGNSIDVLKKLFTLTMCKL
jgi:hypothetical protein